MAHLSTNQHPDNYNTFNLEELTFEQIYVLQAALKAFEALALVEVKQTNIQMIKNFINHKSTIADELFNDLDLEGA